MKIILSDIFNLKGKITREHAEEIDEILDALLERSAKTGALKMFEYISKKYKWEEEREFKKTREYYENNVIDEILCKTKSGRNRRGL